MNSIVLPELRKAYFAELVGQHNADPTKRLTVEAHSYRFTLIAGVQPERAGVLLDDAAGGTPQRFLWFTTQDFDVPEVAPEWYEPKPLNIRSLANVERRWGGSNADPDRLRGMDVCDTAMEMMDHDMLLNLGGKESEFPAHRLITRLKVAAWESMMHAREGGASSQGSAAEGDLEPGEGRRYPPGGQ